MRRFSTFVILSLFLVSPLLAEDSPAPFKPSEAPGHMTLPEGFRVTLFAGEPDVVQPIAFTFDDRGRMWVVECRSYPNWSSEHRDRILILEDQDGDGKFDSSKVFWDQGINLTGIALGFGGVWLSATPNLIFLPNRDGDDVADGEPEIVLDGWDLKAKHNVFNALMWGPDGWLYGCNGILSNSLVGKPNTPESERVPLNCGVWRFHPLRRVFEVVATGTTNPWGLDFDEYGQLFITNCVIQHLWHVVPGAHFQRMFGQDFNLNLYQLMESCADHIHWGGGPWHAARDGKGKNGEAGGGHAHVGAMVYLGDNWPDRYRNSIFMCNIHGNRINQDYLKHEGSSYVAKHAPDFLFANDPWFRGLYLQYGPDGGVYVADWTDTGECHNYVEVDRANGRIYKVVYGKQEKLSSNIPQGDLAKLDDGELVKLLLHKNDWFVRHSSRLLQERATAGKLTPAARTGLLSILQDNPDVTRKLRALWTLHAAGGLTAEQAAAVLESPHEYVKSWGVHFELEDRQASASTVRKFADLAAKDPSPVVRMALASGLQRMPLEQRWPIAEALVSHAADAEDLNLSLMLWYGIEPLIPADEDRALALLAKTKIPLIRESIARRYGTLEKPVQALEKSTVPEFQRDVLRGMHAGLKGRRTVGMPAGWSKLSPQLISSRDPAVREVAIELAVIFGDQQALKTLKKLAADSAADGDARRHAVQALVQKQDADLVPLLQSLLTDKSVRGAALRGLGAFGDATTPQLILRHYAEFSDDEKQDAIGTLASRPAYALPLLDALEQEKVSRRDLTGFTVRQLAGLNDKQVHEKLVKVWGEIRPTSKDKAALIAKYKAQLTPEALHDADRSRGRLVFSRTCAACHKLFDAGGKIGPELTGSQRANLDYVLENLLDPNAVVGRDFQVTIIETKAGRVLNGIILEENANALTLQTANEMVIVPLDEIETRTRSTVSMMPEELLTKLEPGEARDLIAYLAGAAQVPLPPEIKTGAVTPTGK